MGAHHLSASDYAAMVGQDKPTKDVVRAYDADAGAYKEAPAWADRAKTPAPQKSPSTVRPR